MPALDELWPLYRLRLRTDGLELRFPSDDELAALAELTREPLHDPEVMPFSTPWTDQPEEERVRGTLQWNWRLRGQWTVDEWHLALVAVRGGQVLGAQGITATKFAVTRQVESGSWVGRRFQGQGVGTAMRRAMLHLAFSGLGAGVARSGAFEDNAASLRVSQKLGYEPDGTSIVERRGRAATIVRLALPRKKWEELSPGWRAVEIDGLEPCLSLFGI